MSNLNTLVEYDRDVKGRFSRIDNMRVERGTIADWHALHALHYKAESLPAGAVFYRCVTEDGRLVGICVLTLVSLLLAARHEIFPALKPGKDTTFSNTQRGKWLNVNMRRASRIVTDTLFRGVGISYRMVNLSMRIHGFKFIEIQSSMSKFNPFDLKAGFQHGKLKTSSSYDTGFAFLRSYFQGHPADHEAITQEFKTKNEHIQAKILEDMRVWYFKNSFREKSGGITQIEDSRVLKMPFDHVLREIQQLVFATPVYGIWKNPDLGREIPQSLPLSAFDLQKPNEPLRLDLL
jgi:hypothetical protein